MLLIYFFSCCWSFFFMFICHVCNPKSWLKKKFHDWSIDNLVFFLPLLHEWAACSGNRPIPDTSYTCVLESSFYAHPCLQRSFSFHQCYSSCSHGNYRETHLWPVSFYKNINALILYMKFFLLINLCFCFFVYYRSNPKYKDSPPEAIFVNVLGVLLVVFGALILWIATRTPWKRPSEQILHSLHTNSGSEDNSKVGPALSELGDGANSQVDGDVRKRNSKSDT